jgi:hypothetical protein
MICVIDGLVHEECSAFVDLLEQRLSLPGQRIIRTRHVVGPNLLQVLKTDVARSEAINIWAGPWYSPNYTSWENEWLFGRAIQPVGLRYALGYSTADFARRFNITTFACATSNDLRAAVDKVANDILAYRTISGLVPPNFAGDPSSPLVFIGEALNARAKLPAWLPFTTPMTTKFGWLIGDDAIRCGWTNINAVPVEFLRSKPWIIACGAKAYHWVVDTVNPRGVVFQIAHPSWMLRYNNPNARVAIAYATKIVNGIVKEVFHK